MSAPKYSIIPKPQKYEAIDGTFTVTPNTAVLCVPEFKNAGMYLSEFLRTKKDASDGAIKFNKDDSLKSEGYRLKISSDGITITASDARGAFYGAVTLKIIIMQGKQADGKAVLNGADIYDYPEYEFRSGMLDESRHFFGADAVKRLLDSMAMVKLNKFHWHLSDDQGFRIESEKFPRLNEIGSKRKDEYLVPSGALAAVSELKITGGEYCHYYKKSEIREIVEYAQKLCIDIIPEIDMPGHTVALLASYKELSCMKGEYEVNYKNGIMEDILCAGQPETYEFLEKLLQEICELFPYKYFHIGGDEALFGHKIWEKDCPVCQAEIKKNSLKNGAELQELFISRINKILNGFGKTCIEWNDGVGEKTDENIICQYWTLRGPMWLKKEMGKRKFIISPVTHFYFDYSYAHTPLKKTYSYVPPKFGDNDSVLGFEFEMWTEWITEESAVQFSVYPRIFAVAELAWTRGSIRNYKDFYKRLDFFKAYMRSKNINYSRLEKRKLAIRNRSGYNLGKFGPEYKYNEKIKETE
ncbi:MAG: beta-N-acetylhexosaminidase [Oscillospiraceae bacterium]|nr:beta-N-acetylhexosaminidase [Oscillospiraceae bacterium]